jgi:hypothetical protein
VLVTSFQTNPAARYRCSVRLTPRRPRNTGIVTRAAVDYASAEISSVLGGLAATSASLTTLALAIRKANGFDKATKVTQLPTSVATEVQATTGSIASIDPVQIQPTPVDAPVHSIGSAAPVKNPQAANEAAQWIASWKAKTDAATVRSWIASWRSRQQGNANGLEQQDPAAPQAIEVTSVMGSTLVTEPTLPASAAKANPTVAAAMLEAVTADAPVGATVPGKHLPSSGPTEQSNPKNSVDQGHQEEKHRVPMLAAVAVAKAAPGDSPDSAREVAREYGARVSQALQANESPEAVDRRSHRTVTITEHYQEKIAALWQIYKKKKMQEAALVAKQEKLTMDLKALEASACAEHPEKQAEKLTWVLDAAAARVMAILSAVWAFVVAMISRFTGGAAGGGGEASTASA